MTVQLCFPSKFRREKIKDGQIFVPVAWQCFDYEGVHVIYEIRKQRSEGESVHQIAMEDLKVLATIGKLGEQLVSPEAKGHLLEALKASIADLDLPSACRVLIDGHIIREHSKHDFACE